MCGRDVTKRRVIQQESGRNGTVAQQAGHAKLPISNMQDTVDVWWNKTH